MKIGVDAQTLLGDNAGVAYYTRGILKEVLRQDQKNRYNLLFFHPFYRKFNQIFERSDNFHYGIEKTIPYKVFYKLHKLGIKIPLEIFFGKHDLYFFPNFVVYPHRLGKSVVVVHDLAFEKVPQYVQDKNVRFLKKFVPRSLSEADHVVVTSEYTKADVVEIYGISEDNITVIYPGVDLEKFRPSSPARISQVREKYGLAKPFILYLSTLEPRKNVLSIIKAFAGFNNKKGYQLVLAGKRSWQDREIFEKVKELGLEESVVFPGYIPDQDKPDLLSAAEVFVYPSFFEGFGMPVIEAQACGTPVIASNVTSLPEVGGNAAVYVDPNDADGLTRSLEEILSSSSRRENLAKMGLGNGRGFSWENSSRNLIQVFERV